LPHAQHRETSKDRSMTYRITNMSSKLKRKRTEKCKREKTMAKRKGKKRIK
jgi:hypothetical protein